VCLQVPEHAYQRPVIRNGRCTPTAGQFSSSARSWSSAAIARGMARS
jgi:hypothetical protein